MANLTNNNKVIDEIKSRWKQISNENDIPEEDGLVFQYLGTTNENYTYGYVYKVNINSGVLSTERIDVQPNPIIPEYKGCDTVTITDEIIIDSSAVRGPCDEGFHVPSSDEFRALKSVTDLLGCSNRDDYKEKLHMPLMGYRYQDGSVGPKGNFTAYRGTTPIEGGNSVLDMGIGSDGISVNSAGDPTVGKPVRAFKDTYVEPDNTWTVEAGTLGSAGIFHNATLGLISVTNGSNKNITMKDKNVGATTVYNDGDTLTQDNMGNYYQWGNNYGFPATGTYSKTSSTQVDTSSYAPSTYSSDTFITASHRLDPMNYDIWGSVTGIQTRSTGDKIICAIDTDTLVDLKDTTITNPTDGQIVRYDATSEKWINVNLPKDIDITDEMPEAVCDGSQGMIIYAGLYHLEDGYKPGYIYIPTARDSYDFTTDHTLDTNNPSDYFVMQNNLGKIGYNTTDDYYFTVQDAGTNDGYTYQVGVIYDEGGELTDVWSRYPRLKEYATLYSSTDHTVPLYYIKEKLYGSTYKCIKLSTGEEGSVIQRGLVPIADGYEESVLSDCYYKEIQLVDNRLVALNDVTINNISDGDIIKYNSSTGKFENKPSCVSGKDGIRVYPSGTYKDFSDRRGPCEEGFHIPTRDEVANLGNALSNSNSGAQRTALLVALGMCYWGDVYNDVEDTSSNGVYFWTSNTSSYTAGYGYTAHCSNYRTSEFGTTTFSVGHAFPIRPFADNYIEPDSTWLHTNFGQCDVYQKDNLISIEGGNYKATIADKNIGQTEYPNNLEDVRPETVGYYFQWGNSYGKPSGLGSGYMTTTGSVSGDTVNYNNSTWYKNNTWITVASNSVRMWGNNSSQPASQCEVISFDKKSIELVNLKDTNITNPSDGDVIKYDSTSQKWINGTGGSATNQSDIAFATVTLSGTSVTFTNDFITTNTLVSYTILNGGVPAGIVSASVSNGFATFESTASENLQFYVKFEKSNSNSTILTDNS